MTITADQIRAADAVLRSYFPDANVAHAAIFLEAYGAFMDAAPGKKQKAQKDRGEPEGFAAFYDCYPLKKGRRAAAKAYGEALKRAPAGIILTGAQRYATEMAGTEPKYIKHPTTWLNGDFWGDVPPQLTLVPAAFEDCGTEGWVTRLEIFAGKREEPRGTWRPTWGPAPRTEGCRVPQSAKDRYMAIYAAKKTV
jgi:hypothetical protein